MEGSGRGSVPVRNLDLFLVTSYKRLKISFASLNPMSSH
jgi:hypothetical protein